MNQATFCVFFLYFDQLKTITTRS